jgi:hypothetical protein
MVKICQDLQMIADSARLFCLFCQDLPSRAVFSSPSWSADVILHGDHRAANSWGWRTRSGFNQEKGFKASKDGDWKLQTDWTIEKKIQKHLWPSKDGTQVEAMTMGTTCGAWLRKRFQVTFEVIDETYTDVGLLLSFQFPQTDVFFLNIS